jgi:hypothetical protein
LRTPFPSKILAKTRFVFRVDFDCPFFTRRLLVGLSALMLSAFKLSCFGLRRDLLTPM